MLVHDACNVLTTTTASVYGIGRLAAAVAWCVALQPLNFTFTTSGCHGHTHRQCKQLLLVTDVCKLGSNFDKMHFFISLL